MPTEHPPVTELILHRGAMLLVDRVDGWGDGWVTVVVDTAKSYCFCDGNGRIPAWVGIEYMAQTINCYAGLALRQRGKAPMPGVLLGARRYDCLVDSFDPGVDLRVNARQVYLGGEEVALFSCQILLNDRELASADVKVAQTQRFEDLLKE